MKLTASCEKRLDLHGTAWLFLRGQIDRRATFSVLKKVPMSDLEGRFNTVRAKEQELQRREEALRKANVTVGDSNIPNFPPFYPLIYHNIAEEIPMLMQTFIRISLFGVGWLAILSIVNWLACFTTASFGRNAGENIVFGLIIGLFLTPLAFRVTYWKLYRQCKEQSITFWTLALQGGLFLFCVIGVVGIEDSGMLGVMMILDAVANKPSAFTMGICVTACVCWCIAAAWQFFLLGRLLLLFKTTGTTIQPQAGGYGQAQ
jgi:hypothetical protein